MTQLNMLFGALFRPKPTFARLAEGVKWVWLPAVVVLLATSLANVAVTTPLQVKGQMALAEKEAARMQKEAEAKGATTVKGGGAGVVVESQRGDQPKEMGGAESGGDLVTPPVDAAESAQAGAMMFGMVFGTVGVFASLLVTALYFFVAGKVWAKRVVFGTYVSLVALAAMPLAARDILQTVYQSVTRTWIQHQGISSLVAVKDTVTQGGIGYGLLSQIDVWSIWALVLLYLGVTVAAGFEKKRALMALGIFTVVTMLVRAMPAILAGAFAG